MVSTSCQGGRKAGKGRTVHSAFRSNDGFVDDFRTPDELGTVLEGCDEECERRTGAEKGKYAPKSLIGSVPILTMGARCIPTPYGRVRFRFVGTFSTTTSSGCAVAGASSRRCRFVAGSSGS